MSRGSRPSGHERERERQRVNERMHPIYVDLLYDSILTRVRLVFVSIQQCCYHHAQSDRIDYAGSVCSNSLCTCTRRNQVLARIQKEYHAKGMDMNDDEWHYFGIICPHCLVPKQLMLRVFQSCSISSVTTVL